MTVNMTLLTQALVFAILIWFSVKFVWPPLLGAIESRQKKIAEGLAAAEAGQRELAEAHTKEAELLKEARVKASEIQDRAHQQYNQIVDQAKQDAVAEGARQLAMAEAEIANLSHKAKEHLRHQVSALALAAAEKLIRKEIDPAVHKQLLDELIAEI